MKPTSLLVLVLSLGLVGAAPVGVSERVALACPSGSAPEEGTCVGVTCSSGEEGVLCARLVLAPAAPPADAPATTTYWHQFYAEYANDCDDTLPVLSTVCAHGHGEMDFSTGCPGTPGSGQICLQVSGGGGGSSNRDAGRASGGLSHMTSESCSWSGLLGGACAFTFHDPDTGAVVHKHWHDMSSTPQCHHGSATATTTNLGTLVRVDFKTCYKYGPL